MTWPGKRGLGLYQYTRGKETAGTGFFFLGSLFYGAAIMLIAQIYHIGEHFPDGNLVWALGVLPLALILKSRALMILTAALGSIWFMIIILSGLFCELSISWTLGGWDHLGFDLENFFFGAGWCLLCYGLGLFLDSRNRPDFKDYASLISVWALRFFILVLFILSFKDPWREIITQPWQMPGTALAMGTLMGLSTLGLVWAGKRNIRTLTVPGLCTLILIGTMAALILVTERSTAIWFTVVDNLILVASGVWLIVNGIRQAVSHYFFLGVVVILLTGLVRYMDLVGDYIGAAALFTVFAAILLTTARFWKSRFKTADHREEL